MITEIKTNYFYKKFLSPLLMTYKQSVWLILLKIVIILHYTFPLSIQVKGSF